jgi:hypothetical protein
VSDRAGVVVNMPRKRFRRQAKQTLSVRRESRLGAFIVNLSDGKSRGFGAKETL